MKKLVVIGIILFLSLLISVLSFNIDTFNKITGGAVSDEMGMGSNREHTIGPSLEEQSCMKNCVSQGCEANDMDCMRRNSEACLASCNAQRPEITEETSCMEECVLVGCSEFDFDCQTRNQERCENECGMIKEPEAKSEEEQCIRDCVNNLEPGLICQPGEGGEKGDEICQKCAKECEHLYAGPCLNEEKLEQKKKDCQTCEHCYGKPVMGDSGEGYDCIVDVECADASSEFGDNPGIGEGIKKVGDAMGNVIESIGNFFKGVFGGEEENTELTP